MSSFPTDAQVVVIGGGVLGCSVAYHLAKKGVKDVVLVERAGLTQGATWHAAGLVGQLRSSRNMTRMLQLSVALHDTLEEETGQAIDWKKVGSLRLSGSEERKLENRRAATMAKSFGLEMHIIGPQEAQDMFPLMSTEGLLEAIYLPSDGHVDPSSLTQALAKGARDRGARIVQGVKVTGFTVDRRRVTAVETDKGTIRTETVVNAAGFWGREVGRMAGVRIPVVALEHQFLVTEPIPGVPAEMPIIRDPDLLIYFKSEGGGLAIGGWEPDTVAWAREGIPEDFCQDLLPDNFERFEQLALNAGIRVPAVNEAGVRRMINGPIPWSADSDFVMGKVPELDNYYAATGFTFGIAAGGGAGHMIAEWIVDGAPSLDLWGCDVRRFNVHQNTKHFLYRRTVELYGKYYTIHWPNEEHHTARGIRRSPLYHTLKDKGAVYGAKGGWERANWFAPDGAEAEDAPTFMRPGWFEKVGEECRAVRQRVALIDMTSFSKIEVRGPGALAALQRLSIVDLDKPVGAVVYTQLCNQRGGIEADLTICRLAEDRFYIVTGSAFGVHDLDWIERHLPADGSAFAFDVTSAYAVINLCGPLARKVLEKVAEEDVSNAAFPFARCRNITVGAAPVLAVRISYVGELGWELHVPTEYAGHLYEVLWEAGREFGVADVGYRAIDSLRLEKGYLAWSTDISPDYSPFEAGLGGRVNFAKGDFIGRDALIEARDKGVEQKLCMLTIDGEAWVRGGEAILRHGHVLGVTTSGGYAYGVGKPVVYGYLPVAEAGHADYQIEAFSETFPATRLDGPLHDPAMERMKG